MITDFLLVDVELIFAIKDFSPYDVVALKAQVNRPIELRQTFLQFGNLDLPHFEFLLLLAVDVSFPECLEPESGSSRDEECDGFEHGRLTRLFNRR